MFQFESRKQPLELFFEQKYGKVTDYQLFGDGYLVLGFSEGYISHISTHMAEVRDEVSSEQIFTTPVYALATNDVLHKLAVGTDHVIKIIDIATWK
jgi:WD repeat-containing protein 19